MIELRQRNPRKADVGFLNFVRGKPCCTCYSSSSRSQAAHIRMACPECGKRDTGFGERPDDCWSVPLCRECHLDGPSALHKVGEKKFWKRIGLDPFEIAVKLYAEYQELRK